MDQYWINDGSTVDQRWCQVHKNCTTCSLTWTWTPVFGHIKHVKKHPKIPAERDNVVYWKTKRKIKNDLKIPANAISDALLSVMFSKICTDAARQRAAGHFYCEWCEEKHDMQFSKSVVNFRILDVFNCLLLPSHYQPPLCLFLSICYVSYYFASLSLSFVSIKCVCLSLHPFLFHACPWV